MEGTEEFSISKKTQSALKELSTKRILFAHHSVGNNIIDGLQALAKESGVSLRVRKLDSNFPTDGGVFLHFTPGKNRQPEAKIEGFVKSFKENNSTPGLDIAFLKFCFVDFTPESNVEEILTYYKQSYEDLQKSHPDVTFVHLTVPLTVKSITIKDRLKRLLGLQVWSDSSNVIRGKYNALLFQTFQDDSIFDLASVESTRLDGSRVEFTDDGMAAYSLAPEYTNDGGHLNNLGRKVVASELANFLMNLPTIQNQ